MKKKKKVVRNAQNKLVKVYVNLGSNKLSKTFFYLEVTNRMENCKFVTFSDKSQHHMTSTAYWLMALACPARSQLKELAFTCLLLDSFVQGTCLVLSITIKLTVHHFSIIFCV